MPPISKYLDAPISGTERLRFSEIHIVNPDGLTPSITFVKEKQIVFSDGKKHFSHAGSVTISYEPNKLIPLVDPVTREPTGQTVTMQEAYGILLSAAMQADTEIVDQPPI